MSSQGLQIRATLFQLVRTFFNQQDFLEVDTPIRQPIIIPEANIRPLSSEDCFLQSSPELYMKRLLAAGCPKIFQICRCFRAGERGRLHLEEFVMVEWYRLDEDYNALMDDCEQLLRFISAQSKGDQVGMGRSGTKGIWDDPGFDLAGPFDRLRVDEAFARYSPISLDKSLLDDCFDEILVEYIEPNLGNSRPLFLYDYPAVLGSLAKLSDTDRGVAERFELYIKGVELANGFSELTDALEQRQRFEEELAKLSKAGFNWQVPERFLRALGQIDKAAGIAFGFDRLLMLLMGEESIGNVVPFSFDEL